MTMMNKDLCYTTEWWDTRLIAHLRPITSFKITTSNVDFQSRKKSTKIVDENNNNIVALDGPFRWNISIVQMKNN